MAAALATLEGAGAARTALEADLGACRQQLDAVGLDEALARRPKDLGEARDELRVGELNRLQRCALRLGSVTADTGLLARLQRLEASVSARVEVVEFEPTRLQSADRLAEHDEQRSQRAHQAITPPV